ncbi:MAG: PD-(D/E)XK motif protein [Kofleriaceae bacterium]
MLDRLEQTVPEADRFAICSVLGHCHLAKSPEGRAALLIACSPSSAILARTSGALLISARSRVTFIVDDQTSATSAVVIECLEPSVVGTFLALALDVAEQLGATEMPTVATAFRALAGWERLLRTRTTLSEESELGLWGELMFIRLAPSQDGAIRSWTTESRGIIDFAGSNVGVEVKTSAARLRHSLSHQQARSSDGSLLLLFASIWAVPDSNGQSLADLVASVSDATGEVVAFEQKLLALGYSHRDKDAYTRRFALGGPITHFLGTSIPRVRGFDPGVSAIRYVIDLDDADALDAATAARHVEALCGATPSR